MKFSWDKLQTALASSCTDARSVKPGAGLWKELIVPDNVGGFL
jgi:hypothetical protein